MILVTILLLLLLLIIIIIMTTPRTYKSRIKKLRSHDHPKTTSFQQQ